MPPTLRQTSLDSLQGLAALGLAHVAAYALLWVVLYTTNLALYAAQGATNDAIGGLWFVLLNNLAMVQLLYAIPLGLWIGRDRPGRSYGVILGTVITILGQAYAPF